MTISVERTIHATWKLSAIVAGHLVTRSYYGYTKGEAMRQFKQYLKTI